MDTEFAKNCRGTAHPASPITRDVIGKRFINDYVGGDYTRSQFQLGLYNEKYWNSYIEENNCYSYACNIQVKNGFPHPGYCGLGRAPMNRDELLHGIFSDGIVQIVSREWGSIPCERVWGTPENPAWIIALCDGYVGGEIYEYSYHFYRKVWSGIGTDCGGGSECFWAHKFSDEPVTHKYYHRDDRIIDPEVDTNLRGYKFIGYFLVPPNITIYGPELEPAPDPVGPS